MIRYILLFLSLIAYDRLIKDRVKLILVFSVQMFLILAFRASSLGNDLGEYATYYASYQQHSLWEMLTSFRLLSGSQIPHSLESGYVLLNWIIGRLGFDFHGYLVIHAAICVFSISFFIHRYSKDVTLSYALFLALGGFSYFFGILRQSLGLAFFLFAIPALKQRNAKRYFAWVALSVLFHRVCIAAVPLYFLVKLRMTRKNSLIVLGISLATAVVTPLLGRIIIEPILSLIGKDGWYSVGSFQWNNMFLLIAILFMGYIYICYADPGCKRNRTLDNSLAWMMAMALPIQALAFYIPIFSRVSIGLFLPAGYILVANMVSAMSNPVWKARIRWGMLVVLFAFYLYITWGDVIVPYRWVFS